MSPQLLWSLEAALAPYTPKYEAIATESTILSLPGLSSDFYDNPLAVSDLCSPTPLIALTLRDLPAVHVCTFDKQTRDLVLRRFLRYSQGKQPRSAQFLGHDRLMINMSSYLTLRDLETNASFTLDLGDEMLFTSLHIENSKPNPHTGEVLFGSATGDLACLDLRANVTRVTQKVRRQGAAFTLKQKGFLLASAGQNGVHVYDLRQLRRSLIHVELDGDTKAVAWSQDNTNNNNNTNLLFCGGGLSDPNILTVDTHTASITNQARVNAQVTSLTTHQDLLVCTTGYKTKDTESGHQVRGGIQVRDSKKLKLLKEENWAYRVLSSELLPDGHLLASTDAHAALLVKVSRTNNPKRAFDKKDKKKKQKSECSLFEFEQRIR
jgi:hypothetical protein